MAIHRESSFPAHIKVTSGNPKNPFTFFITRPKPTFIFRLIFKLITEISRTNANCWNEIVSRGNTSVWHMQMTCMHIPNTSRHIPTRIDKRVRSPEELASGTDAGGPEEESHRRTVNFFRTSSLFSFLFIFTLIDYYNNKKIIIILFFFFRST